MARSSPTADLYISADVEADGPIPGPYSMLAIGLCVAGRFDGTSYEPRSADNSLYLELAPISECFDPQAVAVSGLDRERLRGEGIAPARAMAEIAGWIEGQSAGDRAVICAYPASFDWLFLYWYLVRFVPDSKALDFSSCLDMKSMYATKARARLDLAGRDDLPPELRSARTHTHNALDDAREQAEIFSALFQWRP